MTVASTAIAGWTTSGVSFFGEFTSGDTSTAESHSSGHGLIRLLQISSLMNLRAEPIVQARVIEGDEHPVCE
jgi:hypothetical protein